MEHPAPGDSAERDEAVLAALRDRMQQLCVLPAMPAHWYCESAMLTAEGFGYGGDFYVARAHGDELQMVLVDTCGHGDLAVPEAAQFAAALDALVASLPADQVMAEANRYLLHSGLPDSLTTAVQLVVNLVTGAYRMRSAGHPPAMRWSVSDQEWVVDNTRGTALGVTDSPDLGMTEGVLAPGEALLFYTDGMIEARGRDIDEGIEHLRVVARDSVAAGFAGATDRMLVDVERGEDDRAVLVLLRDLG